MLAVRWAPEDEDTTPEDVLPVTTLPLLALIAARHVTQTRSTHTLQLITNDSIGCARATAGRAAEDKRRRLSTRHAGASRETSSEPSWKHSVTNHQRTLPKISEEAS